MPKIIVIIDEETIKAAKIGTGIFKNLNPLEVVRWIEEKSQTLTDEEIRKHIKFSNKLKDGGAFSEEEWIEDIKFLIKLKDILEEKSLH